MTLLRLGWKNLLHKPWQTALSLVLAALGAGLISFLFLMTHQLEQQFQRNLAGVDLVIGAKGSPLQLILSNLYHLDAPTGNIPIAESKAFLNPRHPYIGTAIPLSLGDSYRGYRIVGTQAAFLDLYEASLAEGRQWQTPMEVVAGAAAADALDLKLGSTFQSSHGLIMDEDLVHADAEAFEVVGLLQPTGTVADQLLLTANESLWMVHEHAEEEEEEEEAAGEEADTTAMAEEEHDHEHYSLDQPLYTYEDKDITSILIKFKARNAQTLNMQRLINEGTNLQAATPAIEINRIYANLDTGERALRILAYVIIAVSILSIFISLYANLNERRYELALMRVMGATRGKLFALIMLEGVLLAFVGCLLGIALSHIGVAVLGGMLEETYRYSISPWIFLPLEAYLLGGALVIGLLASLAPAVKAGSTDIHKTLAED